MTTALDLVAVARGEVGTTEHPRGSNRSKYGAWYGMNGVAWCSIFVAWCAYWCGMNLRRLVTPGYASCELALIGYRAKGWTVPESAAQPGDVLFFQFDRDRAADHTGIVESVTGGRLVTIEGNTGIGNDANGGAVMRRTRQWSQVKGIGRIPFAASLPTLPDPSPVPPTVAPDDEDDDMPGYIFADKANRWWLTDGIIRRYVTTGQQAKELAFLGQARNELTAAGDVVVRTAPDGFLEAIPKANP